MTAVKTSIYLVIEPQHNWRGEVESIRVDRTTQTPPKLKSREIAVKVNLQIERNVFEQFLPVVDINLSDPRSFLTPTVDVEPPPDPDTAPLPVDEPDEET